MKSQPPRSTLYPLVKFGDIRSRIGIFLSISIGFDKFCAFYARGTRVSNLKETIELAPLAKEIKPEQRHNIDSPMK